MRQPRFGICSLLGTLLLAGITSAQRTPQPLPKEARERLEHAIGTWTAVTRFYNRDGKVVRETRSTDSNRYIIPGRVIEHTSKSQSRSSVSKGLMFYNSRDQKFYMTSVDEHGDLWILSGGLDKYILTSRPRKRPNGNESMIRFIHEKIGPDSFEAQLEFSRDGGKTWRKGSRQFLKRIKPNETATARSKTTDSRNKDRPQILTTIAMRVHHLDKMVQFYGKAFGFKFREVETSGIKSQFGKLGGMTLKLVPLRAATDFTEYPLHQPGFVVGDVEAVVALAKKYGGRQEGKLTRKDGIVTSGAIRDPDGNTVELYRKSN